MFGGHLQHESQSGKTGSTEANHLSVGRTHERLDWVAALHWWSSVGA